jgi:hypothetical protein
MPRLPILPSWGSGYRLTHGAVHARRSTKSCVPWRSAAPGVVALFRKVVAGTVTEAGRQLLPDV